MAQIRPGEAAVKALELPAGKVQLYVWDAKTTGFGVVVGAATKTFVARAWVRGRRRRVKRRHVARALRSKMPARRRTTMLGTMATGVDPNAPLAAPSALAARRSPMP